MNMHPIVSVVIPCYNHGKYIQEAISSVLESTFIDFEIIVVNDGSTDKETNNILDSIHHPKIRVITTPNKGAAQARNTAIVNSHGEYILALDSDNKIHPEYIEKSAELLKKNSNIGIVRPEIEYFGRQSGHFVLPVAQFPDMLFDNALDMCCMFRKKDWERVGGFKQNMIYAWEDWDFWISILELGVEVAYLNEILFYYRVVENSRNTADKDPIKTHALLSSLIHNHKKLYAQHGVQSVDDWFARKAEMVSRKIEKKMDRLLSLNAVELEHATVKETQFTTPCATQNKSDENIRLLILLVQHGRDKYPNAVDNFRRFLDKQLPGCEYHMLLVDNLVEHETQEYVDGILYLNGDNTCWEFSAWDATLMRLGDQIYHFDFICFTTSALFAIETQYLTDLTIEKLVKAKKTSAVCGKIDTTPESLELKSNVFNRWIRTSLFFVPPALLPSIGKITTFDNLEGLFTNIPETPFTDTNFINDVIKQKILFWLTDPRSAYHSKFTLDKTTFDFFKKKTLAILNEYALTLRLFAAHTPVINLSTTDTSVETLHIISPVNDFKCYDSHLKNNEVLQDEGIFLVPMDNTRDNNGVSYIYNKFIDSFVLQARGWLCFCHQDLQFLENPLNKCVGLDKQTLYGVAGGRLTQNGDGKYIQEFIGKIFQPSQDGTTLEMLGTDFPDHSLADALDCVVLLAHSDLFLETGLRFDENLNFHQYVDELCLRAKKQHGVKSRVIHIRCFHESNAAQSIRGDYFEDVAYVQQKHKDIPAAGNCAVYGCEGQYLKLDGAVRKADIAASNIYKHQSRIDESDTNVAIVLANEYITDNSRILDVGCSCGDCGAFLKEHRNVQLCGFEFDSDSIKIAQKRQIYSELTKVDLNSFTTHSFPKYYRYFDTVLCADVLEHLYDPLDVLLKLKDFIKYDGSLVVSIPNIGHMNVILGLMSGNFHQCDSGILDKTHIRFFTRKSLALLFTRANLEVVDATVTFLAPHETGGFALPKQCNSGVYETLAADLHFFVLQYVCKLQHASDNHEILFTKNSQALLSSVHNNPKSINIRHDAFRAVAQYSDQQFDGTKWQTEFAEAAKNDDLGNQLLRSGLFDTNWYMVNYPCAAYGGRHPLLHYIEQGWTLGWNPSEAFDTLWYLNEYPDVAASGQCPLLHYIERGIFENRHTSAHNKIKKEDDFGYYEPSQDDLEEKSSAYVAIAETPISGKIDTRLIAFYLPQYYPFELNNKFWGEGFTDWRNVASAKPLFKGHYQPHIPIDLGYYDLRLDENALRQIELAKLYGIHGFCYYYYWFGGKRLMEMPASRHLANKQFDFPYCLCWAPETWRTTWHSSESIVMLEQPPVIDVKQFFCDILPFFQDKRYIRVNDKPLLMIYHPTFFEKNVLIHFLETLRNLAIQYGVGDLYVIFAKSYVQQAQYTTPEDLGGDAFADFPPHGATFPLDKAVKFYSPTRNDLHQLFDMRAVVNKMGLQPHYSYMHYPTVMPMWDNTARAVRSRAWTFMHASPKLYQQWLENAIRYVAAYKTRDERIVFINAWNEWAEGAHLEPDMRYGYAFLNATRQALENSIR